MVVFLFGPTPGTPLPQIAPLLKLAKIICHLPPPKFATGRHKICPPPILKFASELNVDFVVNVGLGRHIGRVILKFKPPI